MTALRMRRIHGAEASRRGFRAARLSLLDGTSEFDQGVRRLPRGARLVTCRKTESINDKSI